MAVSFVEGIAGRGSSLTGEAASYFAPRLFPRKAAMKGQMFIITVIFLVGLVFTAQQLLQAGTTTPSPLKTDHYILSSILVVVNDTVQAHKDNCFAVKSALENLKKFIETSSLKSGFSVGLSFEVQQHTGNCDSMTGISYAVANIFIRGKDVSSSNRFYFCLNGEVKECECSNTC